MTRKLLIVLTVLTLCIFSLISSFFGERGIIVNNQLKRQLKENEYELDRRNVELENLKIQQEELSTEDGLRSAAINLGYQVESDDVYVFSSEDAGAQETVQSAAQTVETKQEKGFKPWSTGFSLLISFCSSFIITFIIWLFIKDKGHSDDSQQEESGDIGDNLNLN